MKISQKYLDFLVVDSVKSILVIELNDKSHKSIHPKQCDDDKDRI